MELRAGRLIGVEILGVDQRRWERVERYSRPLRCRCPSPQHWWPGPADRRCRGQGQFGSQTSPAKDIDRSTLVSLLDDVLRAPAPGSTVTWRVGHDAAAGVDASPLSISESERLAGSFKALAETLVPLMEDGGSLVGMDFDASVAWATGP